MRKLQLSRRNGWLAIMVITLTLALLIPTSKQAKAQGTYVDMQIFYDNLAPYGMWLHDPQYGYVWSPFVEQGFRPYYTNGHWVMTQYGNMWMSNYPWGWATFHYGRWTYNNIYGWLWIPGYEWGPAWVSWRQGGGYYGWAPLGPGISINISFGNYYAPNNWWTFVPYRHIHGHNFHRYYTPRNTVNIIHNTVIINNTYYDNSSRHTYVTGPRRNEIEKTGGRRVSIYNVSETNTAGRARTTGRNVTVYKPRLEENNERVNKSTDRRQVNTPAPRDAKKLDQSVITIPQRENSNRTTEKNINPVNNGGKLRENVRNVNTQDRQKTSEPAQQITQPSRNTTRPVERKKEQTTTPAQQRNNRETSRPVQQRKEQKTQPNQRTTAPVQQKTQPVQRTERSTNSKTNQRENSTTQRSGAVQNNRSVNQQQRESVSNQSKRTNNTQRQNSPARETTNSTRSVTR